MLVQRYGKQVNGGAELHCRLVAEALAKRHEVEVLSSCALDYISWENHFPPGVEQVGPVTLRRFRVKQPRDERRFGLISQEVFSHPTPIAKQMLWLKEQGPFMPELVDFLKAQHQRWDLLVTFSFRYYHSYNCVRLFPQKSILVPTAEPAEAVRLGIFRSTFTSPRVILYNTPEEQNLIQKAHHNTSVPGIVIGVGIENRRPVNVDEVLAKFSLQNERYIIYVGRIDKNKGCQEMFDYFIDFVSHTNGPKPTLLLLGRNVIPIPDHPLIRHLGFISDEEKMALIKRAEVLIMPSYLESLSIVLLEAWACRTAVLANGRSDVLRGQCRRSNGGLYYASKEEFILCLEELLGNEFLRKRLGSLGNKYFRLNYSWDVIMSKYDRAFEIALAGGKAAKARTA